MIRFTKKRYLQGTIAECQIIKLGILYRQKYKDSIREFFHEHNLITPACRREKKHELHTSHLKFTRPAQNFSASQAISLSLQVDTQITRARASLNACYVC